MRELVPLTVILLLAACGRVQPSGYGLVGHITPITRSVENIPQSLISDPNALLATIQTVKMEAPAASSDGASKIARDRAIWDARLTRAPVAANYLLTLQCGVSGNTPSFLSYDLNSGRAHVTIYDRELLDRTKVAMLVHDRGMEARYKRWFSALNAGLDLGIPESDDATDILDPLLEASNHIGLPHTINIYTGGGPMWEMATSSDLRRTTLDLYAAESNLAAFSGGARPTSSEIHQIFDDMAAWRSAPESSPWSEFVSPKFP